ncbi:fibrous sheath-interacting protein 2-like [Sardina pilchardus]|uniref:fibrous sheath-interacting protein 2-like n=1 Tax=Sardina pilchardus TaxID=27697 RepID=UPI002E14999C
MDHSKSSYSSHHCIDHKSPDNCGQQPDIFYTTRLCKKLIKGKGDFDLTDPNGYKLSTAYNCLHDPNLKTYLYRKDIHKHLLKDGFITKDEKVTCSFKEFNSYQKYLTDVRREVDHRFKMEQRELVHKILILQQEGRISPDVSVPHFIEWLVVHRRDHVCNTRQQQMLKEVVEDVQRELRLERRWKHQREQRMLPSQVH